MIKVIYGKKGMGKTKILVDTANNLAAESSGDVVFIDDSSQLMYDLKRKVRFINVSEFPVGDAKGFLGFLCGVAAENYDIDGVFVDRLTYITGQKAGELQDFFSSLKKIAEKNNIKFFFSINGDDGPVPEFMKELIM